MFQIYIVTYDREDKGGHYALHTHDHMTLDEAMEEVVKLVRKTGKCFGIVNVETKELVHETSQYYANLKLKVR